MSEGAIDLMIGAWQYAKTKWSTTIREEKSVEELKADLEKLKTDCAQRIDWEQLSHFAYIIQAEIQGFHRDLKICEAQLAKLNSLPDSYKREVDTQLTMAMVQGRIDAYKAQLSELTEVYNNTVAKMKDESFAYSRVDLDKEIAEAEQDAEEQKKAIEEGKATPITEGTVLVAEIPLTTDDNGNKDK